MPLKRRSNEVPVGLTPILLPGETLVIAVHMHWARLAEPVASTVAALALALWVDSNVSNATQPIATILWWGFFVVVLRLLWWLLDWYHNWFVATDKRLLLRYGLITHKVAMMPLAKVTDMSYERTIPGQLLGYGRFIMESAGQDQALRVVNWVPNSDATYRAICAEIFHILPPEEQLELDADDADLDADLDADEPDDGGSQGPDGRGGPGGGPGDRPGGGAPGDGSPTERRRVARTNQATHPSPISRGKGTPESLRQTPGYPDVHRVHNPVQDRLDSYSRAVPVKRSEEGESIYESEDIRQRRRAADTGPLPLWPAD